MRVAVTTDSVGWQGEQLQAAFDAQGIEVSFISLRHCRFDTQAAQGLRIPGFEDCLPDGVFVRQVPGGTLEQVVLRLDFLHALTHAGVLVYNQGRAIERTVDKAMTSWLLHRAGVPTPPTWAMESADEAYAIAHAEFRHGHELVLKPLFGSQGKGLIRIADAAALADANLVGGVHYLQRFIPGGADGYRDWRVFVIAGRAVAAMERRSEQWISNVARGAQCVAAPMTPGLAQVAQAACEAVQVDYAGVDLMLGSEGELQVIEVNGIPAWQGLQSVCEFNIAQRLVSDFLRRC